MPALGTSGTTPATVERKQVKQGTAPKTPPRTKVQRRTVQAATASTPAQAPAALAGGTRSGRSASTASPGKRRSRPEPALTYEPPKRVETRAKRDLAKLDTNAAQRAKQRDIKVAPDLKAPVKVTKKLTLISQKTARKVASELPKPARKQAAQKLRARKAQGSRPKVGKGREDPKVEGRKEKRVAKKLAKAAKKTQGGLARKLNRGFGPNETITPHQTAIVAESEGLPGKTYEQVAKGESGNRPGVPNPDDGYPSLFQATPSVQSPETVAKWDRIASRYPGGPTNPIVAAKQIVVLAGGKKAVKAGATGISNFVGTQYVTDENAHLPGGQAAARRKLYGNPKPIPKKVKAQAKEVLGKRAAKKVVKQAKHPESKQGRQLSVSELFYDPGVSIKDGQQTSAIGGHSDHVHFATTRPKDMVFAIKLAEKLGLHASENPLIDTVDPVHTEGSYHYQEEKLPKRLRGKAKKLGAVETKTIGQALDVSGSAAAMAKFNQIIASMNSGNPISGSASTTLVGSTGQAVSGAYSASQAPSSGTATTSQGKKKHKKRKRPRVTFQAPPALDISKYRINRSTESYDDYVENQPISLGL
jgi:hypothetical protein